MNAVVRNFEIIGEAANHLPPKFKNVHTEIDWQKIIAFRNRVIHNYFDIAYEIVWKIKEENVSELINRVSALITEYESRNKSKFRKRLSSRNIISTSTSGTTILINYSEESKKLEVEFKGGRVYHYTDVELEKWLEYKSWIEEGKSSGEFVNKYIKPFYDAEELDDE